MGPGMMGWGYGRGPAGYAAGGWPWGLALGLRGLGMLAFWGLVVVGVALLVRTLTGPHRLTEGPGPESAVDILKRRYASGEITQDQYDQMRRQLEQ